MLVSMASFIATFLLSLAIEYDIIQYDTMQYNAVVFINSEITGNCHLYTAQ